MTLCDLKEAGVQFFSIKVGHYVFSNHTMSYCHSAVSLYRLILHRNTAEGSGMYTRYVIITKIQEGVIISTQLVNFATFQICSKTVHAG